MGHLGWFYLLSTVNNAVMNIGIHVSFSICVLHFLAIYQGVELLGHMMRLCLIFQGTVKSVSIGAAPTLCTPTPVPPEAPISYILAK